MHRHTHQISLVHCHSCVCLSLSWSTVWNKTLLLLTALLIVVFKYADQYCQLAPAKPINTTYSSGGRGFKHSAAGNDRGWKNPLIVSWRARAHWDYFQHTETHRQLMGMMWEILPPLASTRAHTEDSRVGYWSILSNFKKYSERIWCLEWKWTSDWVNCLLWIHVSNLYFVWI